MSPRSWKAWAATTSRPWRAISPASSSICSNWIIPPPREPRRGLELSVRHHRRAIRKLVKDSPSLRPHLAAAFDECWQDGRDDAANGLDADGLAASDLPAACPYTLEQLLDEGWWPRP